MMKYCLLVFTILVFPLKAAFAAKKLPGCDDVLAQVAQIQPQDRFFKKIESLKQAVLSSKSIEELAEQLATNKQRLVLLQLQGLLRNYAVDSTSQSSQDSFKKFLKEVKKLEGETAQYMLSKETLAMASGENANAKLVGYLEMKRKEALKIFTTFLSDNGWAAGKTSKVEEWNKVVSHLKISSNYEKDRVFLAQNMVDYIEASKLKLAAIAPIIALPVYDEKTLDDGLHHFRRVLRWVSNMIQSAEGIYSYNELSQADKLNPIYLNFKESVYAKLAEARPNSVKINFIDMLAITKLVTEAGTVKDFGEAHFNLSEAILDSGLASNLHDANRMADEMLEKKLGQINVEERTRELYQFYLQYDPLTKIQKSIQSQLK